jgi:hypothetical protein
MRLRSRLLAALLVAGAGGPASASSVPGQTCAVTGAGSMSCSIADCSFTGSLTADCDGSGDDAGGDDRLEIRGSVACDGDIFQDGTVAAAGIVVDGGSFTCDVADHGNQGTEIRLGPAGIAVRNASTWSLQDRWIRPASPVSFETEPQWLPVAGVIPCPVDASSRQPADGADRGPYEPDCANGHANQVMLAFDGPDSGLVLAAVTPGETLWCWGEADPTRPVADTTSCYEVAERNLADRFVTIDVRQGIPGTSYDWDQREIAEYALAAPLAAGSRVIEVDDGAGGSAFPVDWFHNARWVAFQDAGVGDEECGDGDASACTMGDTDQLALELTYDASSWAAHGLHDTLYVADPRGAKRDYPVGTRVWITYGHRRGETGSFRVPVRVTSATPTTTSHGDSGVVLAPSATLALSGGVLDALRTDIILPDAASMSWTWIRDPAGQASDGCTTGHILNLTNSEDVVLSRVSKTGGSANSGPACDRLHGISCTGQAPVACRDFTIRDLRWRHTGDDTFVAAPDPDSPLVEGYLLERVISEFAANAAQSAEMFQASGWDGGTIIDAYCGDCLSKATSGSGVIGAKESTSVTALRNVMGMGVRGVLGHSGAWDMRNVSLYGADHHFRGGQGALGGNATNFVIDHYVATADPLASEVGVIDGALRQGIIRRSEGRYRAAIFVESGARLSDVLIHETKGGGAGEPGTACYAGGNDPNCAVLRVGQSVSDVQVDHVTVLGHTGMCHLASWNEDTPANLASSLLLVGMSETGASCRSMAGSELAIQEAAAGAEAWCFFGSHSASSAPDVVSPAVDDLPPASLRGVDPLWEDAAAGQYLPTGAVAAAGCGARAGAGVTTVTWAHYLRRIGRDCLGCGTDQFPPACSNGADDDGDGLADFPDDPGCQGLSSALEDPECDDGDDNDLDGGLDWDGAGAGPADPQCIEAPWRSSEAPQPATCGMGPELLPVLACLGLARTRRGAARDARRRSGGGPAAGAVPVS